MVEYILPQKNISGKLVDISPWAINFNHGI